MSSPTPFPQATATLTAPTGQEDEVLELPVWRDGQRIISCWRLTRLEIAEIQRTGRVWLHVYGAKTHAPVCVSGLSPFGEEGKAR